MYKIISENMMRNLPHIKNQLNSRDLFDAFKKQLAKDFEQSNFPADFAEALEPDYDSIQDSIARELQRSQKQTDSNVMPLLYRIDISEAQLKTYLNKHKNQNRFNLIAELIIKRVLQKVVIRQYYKNNETS
jgi:hypothetical protein